MLKDVPQKETGIDLRLCVYGDDLKTRSGRACKYVGPLDVSHPYDHSIQYTGSDISGGTRCDNGKMFRNGNDEPEDIVEIVKFTKPLIQVKTLIFLIKDKLGNKASMSASKLTDTVEVKTELIGLQNKKAQFKGSASRIHGWCNLHQFELTYIERNEDFDKLWEANNIDL